MKIKTTKKRILSLLLCATLLCGFAPTGIASAVASEGLCEHHTEHTEDCGYSVGTEASECTHVHTDECYTANKLACTHVHNESCGYIEAVTATPCTFVCKICSKQEAVDSGTIGNSTLCEKHSFGAWTINEESGFERKCTVCGESEASEEPDFMSGLMELETAEEISAELDRLLAAGIIDQKCDDALSSVFSGGAAPLSAEIAATSTTVKYTGLPANGIDIASAPNEGVSLTLKITARMTKDEWTEHIKTPALKPNGTLCGWQSNGWDKFSFTLPPSVFAESGFVVDWNNVSLSNGYLEGQNYYQMRSSDATDGIIVKGKNTGTSGANSIMASYRYWNIELTIPVTLPKDAYETVCQNGGIKLGEGITLSSEGVDDLYFPISNTVKVFDSSKGNLKVTGEGATYENKQWKLGDGEYTISGTAHDFESIVIDGDVTLTLDGAAIEHTTVEMEQYAPAISVKKGHTTLILSGDNTVEGSPGYAGIYVAKEASLTVQGDGSLSATGGRSATIDEDLPNNVSGYWGSGAGIGGNGVWAYGNDTWVDGSSPNFGTIQIEEGTINAVGGERKNTNVGGGAGIGSGSCSSWGTLIELEGTINISGGIITSVGGDSNDEARSLTGGGAGIGSCGVTGNKFVPYNNNVKVSISGGNITATGKADGAGIGGGANVNGGKIEITGGTVYAEGGYEIGINGSNGGAGIGGGDMGSAESIEISGGTITAKGGGAAAGIGGGYGDIYTDSGYCGTINISGDADIEATGGSNGGPGIGPGKQFFVDISEDEVSQYQNEINISDGKIKATGGGSNAAGIGGLSHTDVVINIRGGEIEATGGSYGAGIGGGNNYNYYGRNDPTVDESRHSGLVEINILGGNIKASGGKYASGIGAGAYGRAANVSISGGYVEATGGCDDKNYGAAGVGSGYWPGYYENIFSDKVFEINITGGTVIAKGRGDERGGAGIGLGASDYEPVKINISGGEVWAYGGGSANGIGGSYYGNFYGTTEIAITGGNVVATGGKFASGIGSGQKGGAVNISITGDAKVNAYGQTFAYAIGKSYETTGAVALTLSDTITLWAQNGDKENLAIPANTKYIRQSESGSIYLATYTDAATTNPESVETNAANKASGRLTDDVATEDNAVSLDWMYKAPQYVTLNGLVEIDTLLEQTSIPGNWATLYSTPKITVSYEWTAGNHPTDVTAPADDVIETGTKYTAKEQDASMQGYRFDGWYTDEGCTQEYQNGSMLNNDTTLYGKWDKLYTVSYDPNGGSGTMTDSNSPYVYGASVTIMENTFIRENYHFTGWNTASDGSGKSYSAGDNCTIEDDITLYAQWKKNTVTPLDPTDPTNPTKPVKPAKPMEPTKPAESNPNTEATLPQTGDDTNVFLWMALLVVSCGGLAGTFAFKKRRTIK